MPMKRELYPPNWEEISLAIREKAGWKCQLCGKQCRRPGEPFETHKKTLTVAHLNHIPSDCREENLKAMCAPCHLRYDAQHHAETRKETNETKKMDVSRFRVCDTDQIVIYRWMSEELNLKGNDLLVYAVIYNHSKADGQWYTGGHRYLAEWCGCTTRGIHRNIKNLKDAGLIIEAMSDEDARWNEYKALTIANKANDVHVLERASR